MPFHRIIFRADFPLNYRVIDRPGEVLRILNERRENYWSELREDHQRRRIIGVVKDQQKVQSLNIEPNALHWSVESLNGWDRNSLEYNTAELDEMFGFCADVAEAFHIASMNRIGFRMFYLSEVIGERQKVVEAFRKRYPKNLIDDVEKELGEITDYAFAFDGGDTDRIKYKVRCGPYFPEQAPQWAKEFVTQFQDRDEYNFICDIDMFELSVSVDALRMKNWCKPLIIKSRSMISKFEQLLESE